MSDGKPEHFFLEVATNMVAAKAWDEGAQAARRWAAGKAVAVVTGADGDGASDARARLIADRILHSTTWSAAMNPYREASK